MTAAAELNEVARVAGGLRAMGLEPVLVGGMALVLLGSRRVTRDFDFVIPHPGDRVSALVDLFYDRGFDLASQVDDAGDIVATIDNRRVAGTRLTLDAPASAFSGIRRRGCGSTCCSTFPFRRPNSPPVPSRPRSGAASSTWRRRQTCCA